MNAPTRKTKEDMMSKLALKLRPEGFLAMTSIKPGERIHQRPPALSEGIGEAVAAVLGRQWPGDHGMMSNNRN